METREYRFIDKTAWDEGPWQQEPDKVQWEDKQTQLPCLIVRHPRLGQLCGYVGITQGHRYFETPYDDVDVDCHGGLTFSGFCQEFDKEHGVCHVPALGEPDHVWWLGFDCAHAYDLLPGLLEAHIPYFEDIYRDLAYVQNECAQLARQLSNVG